MTDPTAASLWHRLRQKLIFASSPPVGINATRVKLAAWLLGLEFVERTKVDYKGTKCQNEKS